MDKLIRQIEQAPEGCAELDLAIWRIKSGQDWRWQDQARETITYDRYGAGAAGNPVVSLDQFTRATDTALLLRRPGWRLELHVAADGTASAVAFSLDPEAKENGFGIGTDARTLPLATSATLLKIIRLTGPAI